MAEECGSECGATPAHLSKERAYVTHRVLLLGALSRLAQSGFVVPPDESLDLIHDFFLETWDRLAARYDPTRAKFETYIFGCFVIFARPRIARLNRIRAVLAAPAEIAGLADETLPSVLPDEASPDRETAHAAIARLPPELKLLLAAYLDESASSERDIAARFHITRYELRQRLADAFGRIAVELGGSSTFPERDREIALALWRDERSVKDAAIATGFSIADVQRTRRAVFARLAQTTKG